MAVAEQESTLRIIAEHKHRAGLLTPVLKEARKVGRLQKRSRQRRRSRLSRRTSANFSPVHPMLAFVSEVHQRSSRMPLKNGWRTLPSADLVRYSISARSEGSTQTPRCAIFL